MKDSPLGLSAMAKSETTFMFFVFFVSFLSGFMPSVSINDEMEALLDVKSQLKDPLNVLESWKPSNSPCDFLGVTCDVFSRVSKISLDNKSLSGVISPSISRLQSLTTLSLPTNHLQGNIPAELDKCTRLQVLNLTINNLTGAVPNLSSLQNLQILDISANFLTGKIPSWVGNLRGLVQLVLGDNSYDVGEIPDIFGNLKNLTYLYLGSSHLKGGIPESIFEMESLDELDLSKNRLQGLFPKNITRLRKLKKIELYNNRLMGEIPPQLAELTYLQEIDISSNNLSGKLPPELGNLKSLTVFECYNNRFSGELPAGFGNLEHLIGFSIYENNFSGEFPANLGLFSPLASIDISENQFSGNFPRFLCEKGKLRFLLAVENNFTGNMPETYAGCKTLQRLRVKQNRLSGDIPEGLWDLPQVTLMDFSDNEFSGPISPSVGNSSSLDQLFLQNNRFSGVLPAELGKLTYLEKFYLNNNSISGSIPPEISNLKQLAFLYLEENSLSGLIPSELGFCARMVDLNLALNSLDGEIPTSLSLMESLNSLNISRNKLTGSIPEGIEKLKLSSIDMSGNQLSGGIPSDLLKMGGDKAFLGNIGLCVDPALKTITNSEIRICTGSSSHNRVIDNKMFVFSIIISVLIAISVCLLRMSCLSWKGNKADRVNDLERSMSPKWKFASFHQLSINADDICNLKEENVIGSGGTGKVYRVELRKDLGAIAVKKLWEGDAVKMFAAEMETLGKIRHRNVLKLYACLMQGGSSYLVLEYMINGNLFQALHGQIKGDKPELDWQKRYNIALGVAKGIAYLHHDCLPPIVHRDIKSTNILLDEDYEPKIADFGIAKVADKSQSGSTFSCLAGTHGYMAPELAYTHKANERCDVYSFGVVLLELVTGRRPIEDDYGEGRDIVYWVLTHLKDRETVVHQVLDNEVVSDTNQDDMIRVLKIAVLCTSKHPSLRPTMREVVKMLMDAGPRALVLLNKK